MRFCNNCGTQMEDEAKFCPSCGAPSVSADNAQQQPASQPQVDQQQQQQQYQPQGVPVLSDWDGSVLDTFVNSLVASLIVTFTCGIATPWAICYILRFVFSHALIDGKRLRFDGKGGSLFGQWIKWFFLTLITCGIYSFWVTPRLYKWIVTNTHAE